MLVAHAMLAAAMPGYGQVLQPQSGTLHFSTGMMLTGTFQDKATCTANLRLQGIPWLLRTSLKTRQHECKLRLHMQRTISTCSAPQGNERPPGRSSTCCMSHCWLLPGQT